MPVAWFEPPTVPDWGAGVDSWSAARQAAGLSGTCGHESGTEVVADRGVRGHQASPGAAAARPRGRRARMRRSQRETIKAPLRHVAMPTRNGWRTMSRSLVDVSTLLGDDAESC